MAVRSIEEVVKISQRYRDILLRAGFPVEKIMLFGSYAKNQQNDSSDIDIAVFLNSFNINRFKTRIELMKYTHQFEEIIEPHPVLVSEIDDDPIAIEAIKYGVLIN